MDIKLFHSIILVENNLCDIKQCCHDYIKNIIKNKYPNNFKEYADKIDNDIYYDKIEIECYNKQLKRDDVDNIKSKFSMQGHESINLKFYIIYNITNSSTIALNSLLKFIEESDDNIFAIFTTTNINKVLPTIKSRSQIYYVKNNLNTNLIATKYKLNNEQLDCITHIYANYNILINDLENNTFIELFNVAKKIIEIKKNINNIGDIYNDFCKFEVYNIKLLITILLYFNTNNNLLEVIEVLNKYQMNKRLIFNKIIDTFIIN